MLRKALIDEAMCLRPVEDVRVSTAFIADHNATGLGLLFLVCISGVKGNVTSILRDPTAALNPFKIAVSSITTTSAAARKSITVGLCFVTPPSRT